MGVEPVARPSTAGRPAGGTGADDLGDPARHQAAELVVVVDDEGAHAFVGHDRSKLPVTAAFERHLGRFLL